MSNKVSNAYKIRVVSIQFISCRLGLSSISRGAVPASEMALTGFTKLYLMIWRISRVCLDGPLSNRAPMPQLNERGRTVSIRQSAH